MSAAGAGVFQSARNPRGAKTKHIAVYLALVLACLVTAGPIVLLFATSLKQTYTRAIDFNSLIRPDFANYRAIWTELQFGQWLMNSLIVAISVTVLILFLDSLAGYVFARMRFRGRDPLFAVLLATLMVPLPVTLLPLFLFANELRLINTFQALIYPALAYPMGVFMMRQFIQTIPDELDDAARIDGMSDFGIYVRVILPLCVPGLAVLGLYTFMSQWGSLLWPLIVSTSERTRTIPPGLATIPGQFATNWGLTAAATVSSLFPMLLVFVVFQRFLRQGFGGGRSTKG